jgi:hypothetical protein
MFPRALKVFHRLPRFFPNLAKLFHELHMLFPKVLGLSLKLFHLFIGCSSFFFKSLIFFK